MGSRLDTLTLDVILTQDALAEKRAVLQRRIADIYKRGPLWAFQVMLAAETFGDLLSRYKYLYLVSRQDESLVAEVKDLQGRVTEERDQLMRVRQALADRRGERSDELDRYLNLEKRSTQTLRQTQSSERAALARMDSLSREDQRLNDIVSTLERVRLANEARAAAAARATEAAPVAVGASSILATDQGKLDWPVDGPLLYRMGPSQGPRRNTRIEYRGIGIKADVGTPVKAVRGGVVADAEGLGTYGASVIIDHGGGVYTLYLYLNNAMVRKGQRVAQGEVIGTSGGANSDTGPHIEFQIRGQGAMALDPLNWLKPRGR
jgi:septal ring factor EnvC (AmiA/AmiB activator)